LSGTDQIVIRPAHDPDVPAVREMLREYVDWIGLDLAFQEIDAELADLPGDYAPPGGALLVATERDRYLAMIAVRPLHGDMAEMKRLYVRPEARGRGLARRLVAHICEHAKALGYREIRLDTLPNMREAQALYEALGFRDIEPYYDTPIAGTRFMARTL
jgi:ribosomal protein S18 acetylase RimI-like enzyme